jgi:hypothetical protein
MVKIHFIGRLWPAVVQIDVRLPDLTWRCEEHNIEPLFRVVIGNSFVNVECELERYDPIYFLEMYRRASDLARCAVNVVAFATGYGMTVVLETFISPDGAPSAIAPQDPSVAPLCTAYSLQPERQADLNSVVAIVTTNPDLIFTLNDLIEAITIPHVAPVNCARAMDRLKHLIAGPDSKSEAHAWKQMRDALRVSEGYLKTITEASKDPRHGRPGHTPGRITSEATRHAWAVTNRYLEYRKRGGVTPLPPDEFPLLV